MIEFLYDIYIYIYIYIFDVLVNIKKNWTYEVQKDQWTPFYFLYHKLALCSLLSHKEYNYVPLNINKKKFGMNT